MKLRNQIPEDMNWADYVDALNNERFSWRATERRRSRTSQHDPERRVKNDKTERDKQLLQAE
jgi:hypothetical protein